MITLIDGDLYQWDTGRVVLVEPDSGYTIHEVHFTNKKMDFAYVVNTYVEDDATYCKIPNILLQQQYSLICYEVRQNSSGEESVSKTTFAINKRNRPEDYIYTEDEKYRYEKIEEQIAELETDLKAELEDLKSQLKNYASDSKLNDMFGYLNSNFQYYVPKSTYEAELSSLNTQIETISTTMVKSVNDVLPDENGNVTVEVSSPSAIIDISDADKLTAALTAENLGNVYRYTGETNSTYTNGVLYEVVDL